MQYPRKQYMDKLIQKKDNGRINVICSPYERQ